jgi:PIN domain nuclease of toxin-antitoxin system
MQKGKAKREEQSAAVILLDTHAAIWLAEGNTKLEQCRSVLQAAYETGRLTMSAISAWELGLLVAKNRLILPKSPFVWIDELVARFGVRITDVTAQIAMQSNFLPGTFHGDPADRIIVATAQKYNSTLLTADKAIIAYSQTGVIKTLPL